MVRLGTVSEAVLDRLVALVRRELSADDVRILEASAPKPDAPNALVARLGDGRHLVASFSEVPTDHDALSRRLDMLVLTFAGALDEAEGARLRLSPPISLHEELRALSQRARALDALVVDAQSPVVWGSAHERPRPPSELESSFTDVSQQQLIDPDDEPVDDPVEAVPHAPPTLAPEALAVVLEAGDRAISGARHMAELAHVQKGKHLRHVESTEGHGYYVVSFSGIYLLVLAFDGPFDELRAERAASEALPRVERLVEALPPQDPEPAPLAGVIAFRRPRR